MSQNIDEQSQTLGGNPDPSCAYQREDVVRYYQANMEIENSRHHIHDAKEEIKELEHHISMMPRKRSRNWNTTRQWSCSKSRWVCCRSVW
jgi:succinate dehydrogenase/fumarate reductase flavoprotein subunit